MIVLSFCSCEFYAVIVGWIAVLNHLAGMTWSQHQIAYFVVEYGLFALGFVECVQECEGLVVLLGERAHWLTIGYKEGRLGSRHGWRNHTVLRGDCDIQREMMAAVLQHPGCCRARRTEDTDCVRVDAG